MSANELRGPYHQAGAYLRLKYKATRDISSPNCRMRCWCITELPAASHVLVLYTWVEGGVSLPRTEHDGPGANRGSVSRKVFVLEKA